MRHVHRAATALHAKALTTGDAPGTFEAVVSVYGNRDKHGDAVDFGAFADSIEAALPPVVWSHDWLTPPIGVTHEMAELTREELDALIPGIVLDEDVIGGLYAKARLLVGDAEDVPLARHVYAALKAAGGDGRAALREFSWGGRVARERIEKDDDGQVVKWVIEKAALDEFGPCLRGANPLTELVAVKAAHTAVRGIDSLLADLERGTLTIAEARKRLAIETGANEPGGDDATGTPARDDVTGKTAGATAPADDEPSQDATAGTATGWSAADRETRARMAAALLP